VTFDGAKDTTFTWKLVNDPVMGGLSNSNWTLNNANQTALWKGEVKIVPSLKAPGFCNAETTGVLKRFNDASGYSHLEVRMRSFIKYDGWKVSFAANTFNPQFASFKAGFILPGDGHWYDIAVPFASFSNDWSPYTGDCDTLDPTGRQHVCCTPETTNVCPKPDDLSSIQQIGLWAEGAAGEFHVEVQWVRATNRATGDTGGLSNLEKLESGAAGFVGKDTCSGRVQANLRYNMSGRYHEDLFIPQADGESMVTAICCDSAYASIAEPQGYYARPDVDLFGQMPHYHNDTTGTTTFYDPVCGLPLFEAPQGRSLADFKEDTTEHRWPSFRTEEVVKGNVIIQPDGLEVKSKCGTHLGSYLPDDKGSRWCIDLACISGHPMEY